ncbi:hypothetical protein CRUP_001302 [Coryphaenoides rupestris]|nr:hypothetical protein CRUP_001302 [Coryphaenoides rupestris]
MKIKDNSDREVIRLIRPFRCVSCWCPCCLQEKRNTQAMSAPGYPGSPNQSPYPMGQPGGYSMAPYPTPQGGYGDPNQGAPPPGFSVGFQPQPHPQQHPDQPVMYQPGPMAQGPPPSHNPQYAGVPPADSEKNDCCTRNCCGSLRSFDMKIKDNSDREVIRLIRPFRCVSCWCPCCLQEMEVQAPPGTTIGYVSQNWHPCLPRFSIQNASKEKVMELQGPCFACNCCGDVNFELKSKDGSAPIGRISKQWSGLLKEVFTDTDNFGIQFPLDMDVKMKAVLMGACFLIDFMFFEKVGEANQRSTVFN